MSSELLQNLDGHEEELDERKAAALRSDAGHDINPEMLLNVFNFVPDVPPTPMGQFSYQERAAKLREKVSSCCHEVYQMPALAYQLVMNNVPQHFDLLNDKPKGCVEIDMTVTKARKNDPSHVVTTWTVNLNADAETVAPAPRPQLGHYGYTVTATSAARTTGHIWFPHTKQPVNCRPWIKGDKSAIGTQTKEDRQYIYKLTGYHYNQYK